MNIDIQFNLNDITVWNYESNDIELKGVWIDIETNLITHINTLYIPPSNGFVSIPLSNHYFQDSHHSRNSNTLYARVDVNIRLPLRQICLQAL